MKFSDNEQRKRKDDGSGSESNFSDGNDSS